MIMHKWAIKPHSHHVPFKFCFNSIAHYSVFLLQATGIHSVSILPDQNLFTYLSKVKKKDLRYINKKAI